MTRSGNNVAGFTVTVMELGTEAVPLLTVRVYIVWMVGLTCRVPLELTVPISGAMVMDVAPDVPQLKVTGWPAMMLVGLAVNEMITGSDVAPLGTVGCCGCCGAPGGAGTCGITMV